MNDTIEARRAAIVASHDHVAARASGMLDDLIQFAANLCDAPMAVVTLIEDELQHFAGRQGIDLIGTLRSESFCTHALQADTLVQIPDATIDSRFEKLPIVTGPPFVRFYAGAPLLSTDGIALGTLCVMDTHPREGLTPLQREGLTVLAKAAMARLDDRRSAREQGLVEAASRRALEESDLRFRTLTDTMPHMVWSTRADGFHDYYNARWYEFTGVPSGTTDGDAWVGIFHADDQERTWERWRHSLATGEPYSIEYRLRAANGDYRWVLGRALPMRDENGAVVRWFGTCTDIHEQRLLREEREVIAQELSHRIKNIFAVISGLIGLAARNRPDFAPIAADLRQRITALGRAHDFVRPHSAQSRLDTRPNTLRGLMDSLFEPYQEAQGDRIAVEGDDISIDDRAATPLALLFHELATNATKYGALSVVDGKVAVTVARDGVDITIRWVERGGPAPDASATSSGFGTQLIELSAVRQLAGTVARNWQADGLEAVIAIPITSLDRG